MVARYFAFGSNMSSARMTERIASAKSRGRGRLDEWGLVCNKAGLDGTAKANIEPRPGDVVWGVIYELDADELERLDAIEGGYRRVMVTVADEADHPRRCWTYTSGRLTSDERLLDWYRALIVTGATEHGLPRSYVARLQLLAARPAEPS